MRVKVSKHHLTCQRTGQSEDVWTYFRKTAIKTSENLPKMRHSFFLVTQTTSHFTTSGLEAARISPAFLKVG
jgi:hypothetical protein